MDEDERYRQALVYAQDTVGKRHDQGRWRPLERDDIEVYDDGRIVVHAGGAYPAILNGMMEELRREG